MTVKMAKEILHNINSPKITDEYKEEAIDIIVNTSIANIPTRYDLWQVLKWVWSE